MPGVLPETCFEENEWLALAAAHEARVRQWTDPHQERASRGERHPVYDFLFDYYAFRPAWLRRWHPGIGHGLKGAAALAYATRSGYRQQGEIISADPSFLSPSRRETLSWLRGMLASTQSRPALFGCFGLHEWAMVYRLPPQEIRHARWPLRLTSAEVSAVVEGHALCCTHFDAFRFFTEPARPLNKQHLTREGTVAMEQRGCLHANMDLYKWAFKLAPYSPSELVADCFELALEIRELDMRASPYDLSALGFEPVCIETPDGKAEYERLQRAFSRRAEPLRDRLIGICDSITRALAAEYGRS
ncbi:MAG: 3-methyladenine DNA glycosylase [Opitutaceae bacterium]|nr:3-methyladenine DNA glycosylase [Opitutaceae bacterium]